MGKAGVEMEVLEIKWDRGCMRVNLEEFLVNANQTKCKKLLKIIREKAPEQEDALKLQVYTFICSRVAELDEKRRNLSSKWYQFHQKKADAKEAFFKANGSMENALYLELDISKEETQRVKGLRIEWKTCERIFKQTETELNRTYALQEKLNKIILPLFTY